MKEFNTREQIAKNILKSFVEEDIEKARAGVYADTPENVKLNRVGQKYGADKKSEDPKTDEPSGESKTPNLEDHAKQSSEETLNKVVSTSKDPKLREAAHKELERRKNEEAVKEEKGTEKTDAPEKKSKESEKSDKPSTLKERVEKINNEDTHSGERRELVASVDKEISKKSKSLGLIDMTGEMMGWPVMAAKKVFKNFSVEKIEESLSFYKELQNNGESFFNHYDDLKKIIDVISERQDGWIKKGIKGKE